MKTWTISSSSKDRLDTVETSVRKIAKGVSIGETVRVVLKNTACSNSGVKVDEARFIVYAALWRDAFDEKTNRAFYVLRLDGIPEATDKAEALVAQMLKDGAHEAGEPFLDEPSEDPADEPSDAEAEAGNPCRAVVHVPRAEIVPPNKVVDDGPFELTSGPTLAEERKAVLEEIDNAEKGVSSARSRMKKLALQIADLRAGGLGDESAVLDYKIAQGEWMSETSALAEAQKRLRDLDAEISDAKRKGGAR